MRELEYKTETVVTRDNDGDEHASDVTYAVVDDDTKGQEVILRNGVARSLNSGEIVVKHGNAYDVFTAKEWEAMWADDERVVDAGNITATDVAVSNDNPSDDTDPNAPEDAVTPPAKKAATSRGQRN